MGKVIETLKASGHQVTLVINTGNTKSFLDQQQQQEEEEETGNKEERTVEGEGEEEENTRDVGEVTMGTLTHPLQQQHVQEERRLAKSEKSVEGPAKSVSQSQEGSSEESPLSSSRSNEHAVGSTLLTNYSDGDGGGKNSSQDTLDGIIESPESLEGDTDFSGMENILNRAHMPLDLHRTSSAPLAGSRGASGGGTPLEASTDSCSTAGTHEEELSMGSEVTGSLDALDGGSGGRSFESRLTSRTGSDSTVDSSKTSKASKVACVNGYTHTGFIIIHILFLCLFVYLFVVTVG